MIRAMTTPARIAANRRNAKKSTGPKTPRARPRQRMVLTEAAMFDNPPGYDGLKPGESAYARRFDRGTSEISRCRATKRRSTAG